MKDGITTGKTHSVLGFDVTIGANMALVPNNDKNFLFRALGVQFCALTSRRY